MTDDAITMSVTHHVTINGDDAWIKIEITSKEQSGETEEEAFKRVNDQVQDKIIKAIENTAQTVIDYEKSK